MISVSLGNEEFWRIGRVTVWRSEARQGRQRDKCHKKDSELFGEAGKTVEVAGQAREQEVGRGTWNAGIRRNTSTKVRMSKSLAEGWISRGAKGEGVGKVKKGKDDEESKRNRFSFWGIGNDWIR
jgi:hypothetical protein